MELTTVWFALIAVLWVGYFCLEGFDFGVGMLLPVLARDDTERRVMINTIGPVWDGNEVWVLVAGGATFAAFPEWYATLFSGFYLPLLLILVALIVRGLSFEYRHKRPDAAWQGRWDLALIIGSFLPSLLWGVAFANIVAGVPIDADKEFTGNLFTLLNPFGLLGGLVTLTLFAAHGANTAAIDTVFPAIKDETGLAAYAARARRDGFTGMMAIHPSQVGPINAAFTPSTDEVARAQAIVDAFAANPGVGVLQVDGKMVDAPHVKQAHHILSLAD